LSSLGATLTSISARRKADARHLNRTVRGELDWIVMKALEKDRRRRYETANDFAADVTRYLTDQPVHACPPSSWYRLSKAARRHRLPLATAVVVALALIVGTAVSVWQSVVAERRRAEADEERRLARKAVDDMYTEVAERWLATDSRLDPVQRDFLERARFYYERFAERPGAAPGDWKDVGLAHYKVGRIRGRMQDYAGAEQSLRRSLAIFGDLAAASPSAPEYRDLLARTEETLSDILSSVGRLPGRSRDAESLLRAALDRRQQTVAGSPAEAENRNRIADDLVMLGSILTRTGRADEGEDCWRRALAIWEDLSKPVSLKPDRNYPMAPHAHLHLRYGLYLELRKGDGALAEEHYRRAVAAQEKLAADHPEDVEYLNTTSTPLSYLARRLRQRGELAAAVELSRTAIDRLWRNYDRLNTVSRPRGLLRANYEFLAETLLRDSRYEDAARSIEEMSLLAPGSGSDLVSVARLWIACLSAIESDRRLEPPRRQPLVRQCVDQAGAILRRATDQVVGDPIGQGELARLLATSRVPQFRDPARAVELAQRMTEAQPKSSEAWRIAGTARYRAGNLRGAIEALEESMRHSEGGAASDWFVLAMAHWRLGDRDKGRAWFDRSVAWMARNRGYVDEVEALRAEAAALLGMGDLPADVFARP
jgi:tetratricopeptide (TPR) repeat protein